MMKRAVLAVTFVCLTLPAAAQEDFDLQNTVEMCMGCHGENGLPKEQTIPIIWGQQFFYLYTELKDFKARRRDDQTMSPIAAQFTRGQMKALAKYFAEKPWPDIVSHVEEGDAKVAEVAITEGQCSACHGKWMGDSRIPRLAGQYAAYLEKTMKDFKYDRRRNAPDVSSTMSRLSDAEIEALARYLSDL